MYINKYVVFVTLLEMELPLSRRIDMARRPRALLLRFLLSFTLGGTTGGVMGNAAMDVALHNTY